MRTYLSQVWDCTTKYVAIAICASVLFVTVPQVMALGQAAMGTCADPHGVVLTHCP
jgi:hypothetical protein